MRKDPQSLNPNHKKPRITTRHSTMFQHFKQRLQIHASCPVTLYFRIFPRARNYERTCAKHSFVNENACWEAKAERS